MNTTTITLQDATRNASQAAALIEACSTTTALPPPGIGVRALDWVSHTYQRLTAARLRRTIARERTYIERLPAQVTRNIEAARQQYELSVMQIQHEAESRRMAAEYAMHRAAAQLAAIER